MLPESSRNSCLCACIGVWDYGSIVQMLQNKEHWEDIGYKVVQGDFREDSLTVIERPIENSLKTISDEYKPPEIVRSFVGQSFSDEIREVCARISSDIKDGLRPDDILVVSVDDRNAKNYLTAIAAELSSYNIKSNNVHADNYSLKDFSIQDHVTLATVHKAKGNEAYSVYVVGCDALFASQAGPRERNMLFTAMTRAKGWVNVSGIGSQAESCKHEIDKAIKEFPNLRFIYPSEAHLKVMQRD